MRLLKQSKCDGVPYCSKKMETLLVQKITICLCDHIWIDQKWPSCFVSYCWFCDIFMKHSGCLGDSLYSSFKRCLLEMLVSGKMKPVWHCSQFQTGRREFVMLCLFKIKMGDLCSGEIITRTAFIYSVVLHGNWAFDVYFFNLQAVCRSRSHSLSSSFLLQDYLT